MRRGAGQRWREWQPAVRCRPARDASFGFPETCKVTGIGAEVGGRRFRAALDAANQSGFFGQFVGGARLGGLAKIGFQGFADEFRLRLAFDPRSVAQALPKSLWKANCYTGGCHVRHASTNVRHAVRRQRGIDVLGSANPTPPTSSRGKGGLRLRSATPHFAQDDTENKSRSLASLVMTNNEDASLKITIRGRSDNVRPAGWLWRGSLRRSRCP